MNGKPGFALSVPANLSGKLRVAEGGGAQWSVIDGPSAVANSQVTFAPVHGTLTLAAGQATVFALYGGVLSQISTASGKVVDFAANTPLAGVKVSIAAYTQGAPASQVATTAADGTFSFTKAPGTYYLVIGSDLPTDSMTTLHKQLILTAGANALGLPVPPAPANVKLSPSQRSGNFRLTHQTEEEQSCINGANEGRLGNLRQYIPDEFLVEHGVAMNQEEFAQNTDTPTPMFFDGGKFYLDLGMPMSTSVNQAGGETTLGGVVSPFPGFTYPAGQAPPDYDPNYNGVYFQMCSSWTGVAYSYVQGSPPFPMDTNQYNYYYGGDEQGFLTATTQGQFGDQTWSGDPRPPSTTGTNPPMPFTPVSVAVPVGAPTPGPIVMTISSGANVVWDSGEPNYYIAYIGGGTAGPTYPASSQTATLTAKETGYNGDFYVMYSPAGCNTSGADVTITQTSRNTWLATSAPSQTATSDACEMYIRNANPGTDAGILLQETYMNVQYLMQAITTTSVARHPASAKQALPDKALVSKVVPLHLHR